MPDFQINGLVIREELFYELYLKDKSKVIGVGIGMNLVF